MVMPPGVTDHGPTTLHFAEGYTGLLYTNDGATLFPGAMPAHKVR
jgi:hypothetical protein